jgi:crossover junction endodeoxyribonuclease RusA
MAEIFIKLPWPPSTNTYYRNIVVKGSPRTLISKAGRQYRDAVMALVRFDGRPAMEGRVSLTVELCAPDKRRRDLDNHLKAIQDALTHANVWGDDSQIDRLFVLRGATGKPGHAMVTIASE